MIRSSELTLHKAGELTLQHDIQNTVNNTNDHILSKENTPKKYTEKYQVANQMNIFLPCEHKSQPGVTLKVCVIMHL
jgi:hypothetical protein